jgi:hypothetical protein
MSQRHLSSIPLVEQCLLGAVVLALFTMLSLPETRGVSESFGSLPFWLSTLPLTAWATARVLRQRCNRERALPMATVHPIAVARPRAEVTGQRALRRAA